MLKLNNNSFSNLLTICDEKTEIILERMEFSKLVSEQTIEPKTRQIKQKAPDLSANMLFLAINLLLNNDLHGRVVVFKVNKVQPLICLLLWLKNGKQRKQDTDYESLKVRLLD